jgi:hypothetical protein
LQEAEESSDCASRLKDGVLEVIILVKMLFDERFDALLMMHNHIVYDNADI